MALSPIAFTENVVGSPAEAAVEPDSRPEAFARPSPWISVAVARGVALFLAGFTLLNLIGAWRTPGFDANVWWIDLSFLPGALEGLLLAIAALLLLAWVVQPTTGLWRRRATLAALALPPSPPSVTPSRSSGSGRVARSTRGFRCPSRWSFSRYSSGWRGWRRVGRRVRRPSRRHTRRRPAPGCVS